MVKKYCQVYWLGRVSYETAWRLQKELAARRIAAEIPDVLLLLEHSPTYTVGVGGHREHLLMSPEELTRHNIGYHVVDRGGPLIYHGPGQLVGYPILNLQGYGYGYHNYIILLEKVVIRTLLSFGIHAFRNHGKFGVWVLNQGSTPARQAWPQDTTSRIATVGVKIDPNGITGHGFFLNVDPDLEFFKRIIPQSVEERSFTSMREVLNTPVQMEAVVQQAVESFGQLLETEVVIENGPAWNRLNVSLNVSMEREANLKSG